MKTDILRRTAYASSEWLWRATAVSVASAGDDGVHAKQNLYAVGRARVRVDRYFRSASDACRP